jgi:hypothetical protein
MPAMAEGPLKRLAEDLGDVTFVERTDAAEEFTLLLQRARRLLQVKLLLEEGRAPEAAPLVVIAGGTNVGKSTIFNWIVGEPVASSSPLARHTKAPTVYVHDAELPALRNGAFLPEYERLLLESPDDPAREAADGEAVAYFLLTHELKDVAAVVLVDSPDIDSTHARNRQVAEDLLFLADAVIFVATPEKYNDQLCIDYLTMAAELSKSLTCVLNKGADEAVARDFEEVVVPQLKAGATVLTLPYESDGPDPATSAGYRSELRQAVLAPSQGGAELRQTALKGARASLGRDLEQVCSRLREELSELDRIRSEVALILDARRDEYARFLDGLEFYELDQVFERVLHYFRIPVLDNVYDGIRGAIGFVSAGVSRLVTGRQAQDAKKAKLEARAETDRQKVKELVQAARAASLDAPRHHAGTLHAAADGWVQGLAGPSVDELNAAVAKYQERAAAEAERWIEAQTKVHVELLEQHPYLRNALRTLKGVFQVGFGVLSAHLTGGLGPWDLLIGTATERATKALLERAGGYVHYQTLKTDFVATQAEIFRELLEEAVAGPLMERLPKGVAPERLERIGAAAATLKRGEVPA